MPEEIQNVFFVSGITGHVGGAAARQLLEEGHTVRTLARDPLKAAQWSRDGVDVRQGDFNDAAAVAGALEGVDAAYLMLPPVMAPAPDFPEAKAIIASFREALRQAPPPRLVVLSSVPRSSRRREKHEAVSDHRRHPVRNGDNASPRPINREAQSPRCRSP